MRVFDQVDPQRVERRELQLTILSLSVNAILAAGAALLMYPTISAHPVIFGAGTSRIFFVGFCILSVLLVGYLFDRQIVVRRLRNEIAQEHLKYSQLRLQAARDLISTLAGLDHFQDRLAMEFKRAAQTRAALSVLVIQLMPANAVEDANEVTVAYGDAAKAMMRKLRREDSLFNFSLGAFGILLPGAKVLDAREFSARIAEGLSDAAGVVGRFTSTVKTLNFPEHVETAQELGQAVRSLLPRTNNSESSRWEDSSLVAAIDDNDLLGEEKVRNLAR
jgi:predicted signal transduction protein with EAL and GGDEF domain